MTAYFIRRFLLVIPTFIGITLLVFAVTGSGSLATFQFLAVAPGDCAFAFTGASVKDPQARNLPAAFNTAAVRVE